MSEPPKDDEDEDSGVFDLPELPDPCTDEKLLGHEVQRNSRRLADLEKKTDEHEGKLNRLTVWVKRLLKRSEIPE